MNPTNPSLHLPPFTPKPWVCEVFQYSTAPKSTGLHPRAFKQIKETFYLDNQEEAEKLADFKCQSFETVRYQGITRQATPRDFAQQRWEQIQEALQEQLEATIQQESEILAYDTFAYGKVDLNNFFEGAQESLDILQEEPETPQSMGWVGSTGRP